MAFDLPSRSPTLTRLAAARVARWQRRGPSVRAALVFLTCAATAPFIVLTGWRARARAAEARATAESRALALAHVVAGRLDERSRMIATLLSVVAPQVRTDSAGTAVNDSLLLAVKTAIQEPVVTNLWVQTPSGTNIGTSRRPLPVRASVSTGDRRYFQDALATGWPTVSDPLRARPDSTIMSVNFAQPVLTTGGQVAAVVLGTVHLGTLGTTLDSLRLPPGEIVVVADAQGRIIGRVPAAPAWFGRSVDDLVRPPRVLIGTDGVVVDEDGRVPGSGRLIAAVRPHKLPWHVYVVLPTAAAFAPVRHELQRHIALGVLTFGVALLFALGAARRITRPLGDLTADATALAAGDYARRTPVDLPGDSVPSRRPSARWPRPSPHVPRSCIEASNATARSSRRRPSRCTSPTSAPTPCSPPTRPPSRSTATRVRSSRARRSSACAPSPSA